MGKISNFDDSNGFTPHFCMDKFEIWRGWADHMPPPPC